jgi:hypothetical protein
MFVSHIGAALKIRHAWPPPSVATIWCGPQPWFVPGHCS